MDEKTSDNENLIVGGLHNENKSLMIGVDHVNSNFFEESNGNGNFSGKWC